MIVPLTLILITMIYCDLFWCSFSDFLSLLTQMTRGKDYTHEAIFIYKRCAVCNIFTIQNAVLLISSSILVLICPDTFFHFFTCELSSTKSVRSFFCIRHPKSIRFGKTARTFTYINIHLPSITFHLKLTWAVSAFYWSKVSFDDY